MASQASVSARRQATHEVHVGSRRLSHRISRVLLYALALVLCVVFFFPLFWALSSSLKTVAEIQLFPPRWLPAVPQWRNYVQIWQAVEFGTFLKNSIVVAVLAMTGQVVCSAAVAYGFAKFRFPGRNFLFLLVLSGLMMPREVTIVPLFLLFRQFGWIDKLTPLIVPQFFGGGRGAFFIFMMRQFFMTIPNDLVEAGKIDGASSWQTFWMIVMPLAKPAISAVAILAFLWSWNDFLEPLVYLNTQTHFTLPLGLRYLQGNPTEGTQVDHLLMAGSVVYLLFPLAIFIAFQKYFVKGVTLSGIKG